MEWQWIEPQHGLVTLGAMPGEHDPYALPFERFPRLTGGWKTVPFRVRFQDLSLRSLAGPYSTVGHRHPHYEIIIVQEGDYRCLVNGHPLRVRDQGAVVLAPGDLHEDCGAGSVRYQALAFACVPGPDPESSWNFFAERTPEGVKRIAERVDDLLQCTARLIEASRTPDAWTPALQDAIANEFLWRLLRRLPLKHLHPELQTSLHAVGLAADLDRLFAENAGRTLGVAEIAKAVGMSSRALTLHCQTELGATPAKLHVRFRMELARARVLYSEQLFADIARHLGFADQFHFSKVYKRVYRVPPQDDRRRSQESRLDVVH